MESLIYSRLACLGIFFLFFVTADVVFVVRGQSTQEGFISVDCGFSDGSGGYRDSNTGIKFSPDAEFIGEGENRNVPSVPDSLAVQYRNLRSFPDGNRSCYSLGPVRPGGKYLIRAAFWYGNYDGLGSIPVFDLHVGVNFWRTVDHLSKPDGGGTAEIIAVAAADSSVAVCLVNTGRGTPFVSTLELRPILDTMYLLATPSQSLVLQERYNFGVTSRLRYPRDPYDRIWLGYAQNFGTLNTTATVATSRGDAFRVPPAVLQTAGTTTVQNTTYFIRIGSVTGKPGDKVYVVMHFAEVERLQPNETRAMDIYGGGTAPGSAGTILLFGDYRPIYMQAGAREANATIGDGGVYKFFIKASANSTRPPILNALESFYVRPMVVLPTDRRDVLAMEDIKRRYRVRRNWMGDPCAPRQFVWAGIKCSYGDAEPPRIVYLNLTSSGLADGIPASVGNLTALTTLDLSNNSLTGEIPAFLAELPSLKSLILTGNLLNGVPQEICKRVQNGSLSLSIDDNQNQCSQSQVTKRKKTTTFVIIIAIVASTVLVLLAVPAIFCIIKRRRLQAAPSNILPPLPTMQHPKGSAAGNTSNYSLKHDNYSFTFSRIRSITNNFATAIGKGGSGTVYLGSIDTKTEVAVKILSPTSPQGHKEFQAEAFLLTRIHHRNLVSLLGYCDEEINLALVYEYMDKGNLHDHLSGKTKDNSVVLSWDQRVKIAYQAAQGLDYLHHGCKPSIVHRDVKSTNILINHDFVAKLADFGLSRAFVTDSHTHISTKVAGTPGYLDPEYFQTCSLNETSDVYSFGVVLLEIITGRLPFPNWPEKTHISQWVRSRLECGDIGSIVDTNLGGDYDTNSCWKLVEIAMACTSLPSVRRPTMSDVVQHLKECAAPETGHHLFGVVVSGVSHEDTLTDIIPLRLDSGIAPSAR